MEFCVFHLHVLFQRFFSLDSRFVFAENSKEIEKRDREKNRFSSFCFDFYIRGDHLCSAIFFFLRALAENFIAKWSCMLLSPSIRRHNMRVLREFSELKFCN